MPLYKTKFTKVNFFVEETLKDKHPLLEAVKPLTPAEMLFKTMNGQPLVVSRPQPVVKARNRFHGVELFDVYDEVKHRLSSIKQKIDNQQVAQKVDNQSNTTDNKEPIK